MERNNLEMLPKYVALEEGWKETSPILGRRRRGFGQASSDDEEIIYSAEMETLKYKGIPKRYILTALCSFGLVLVYSMRVNLSVALVAMVKKTPQPSIDQSTSCYATSTIQTTNVTTAMPYYEEDEGEFDWGIEMQGQVLSSFFYGYVATQIPGGLLAQRYGGGWLFGGGVLLTAFFTLLSPVAARSNPQALIAVRVLMGLAEGVTYPALNSLIGKWIPQNERSKLGSIIYNGSPVGSLISLALTGYLCYSVGWPFAFYIFGVVGAVWFVLWAYFIYESPDTHPTISQGELLYIKRDQKERPRKMKIPWKSILSSRYVWALAATHFAQNWGFYTLLTELPNYMGNILHYNIKTNGILNAIPYLIQPIISITAGLGADYFRTRGHYKITTIRKIFNSFAFFVPSLCIGLVPLFGCNAHVTFALLTISLAANGMIHSGFNITHVDMSPVFAATLMGFTNSIANLSGFLAPLFVSEIIERGQTLENWGYIFTVTSVVFFVGGVIYNLFCTAERQPWNDVPSAEEDVETAEVVDRPR